jgi:D-glycero-D-manno-heptose 1,7-bisphosphate phosphatase
LTLPPSVAFLDRDGTIIDDVAYIARPEQVRLVPGAAEAIARLNALGVPVIIITNQSGIARGLLTVDDYRAVHERMIDALAERGAHIDATFYCPHHPEFSGPCACRKPGTELFEQALREMSLSPSRAIFAGDRWRDVAPADVLGGRKFLIGSSHTPRVEIDRGEREGVLFPSLAAAVESMLQGLSSDGEDD